MDDKAKKSADFILGSKAADLWLYTCDACANEKVIPKKYRYTTGTGLMNAAGEITREKIEESYVAWEAHAKHGDTGALRKQMRARLSAAMARAEHRRAALRLPAPEPGKIERRTKRYGTVNFQSGRRQPGEAGGADQAHQVHQAGE